MELDRGYWKNLKRRRVRAIDVAEYTDGNSTVYDYKFETPIPTSARIFVYLLTQTIFVQRKAISNANVGGFADGCSATLVVIPSTTAVLSFN